MLAIERVGEVQKDFLLLRAAAAGECDAWDEARPGVYRKVKGGWRWFASPIEVLAFTCNDASLNWGRLIEVIDPDGRARRWVMPMAMLASRSGMKLCKTLVSMGLEMESGRAARCALTDYLISREPVGPTLKIMADA